MKLTAVHGVTKSQTWLSNGTVPNWTETEDIKKWQEYAEEQYKKSLNVPDYHDGVVTPLKSDILECEVSGH